jgi:flavin reductase (DIM6/NTAB) family NADH-FMN oxidoreductase RutF
MIADIREGRPRSAIDPAFFRAAMGRFATGVTVITYWCDGEPAGMTANAFMSVSLAPPLVVLSVRSAARFAAKVGRGDHYGVNVLTEAQDPLSSHFGGKPQQNIDIGFLRETAVPLIDACLAHAVARVVDVHVAGDHLLYVGELEHLSMGSDARPLLFWGGRYERLQKQQSPKDLALVHWQGDWW